MAETDRIVGKKISKLFQLLIVQKTIVSLNVVGSDFERLSCILSIQECPNGNTLIVDPPDDIRPALSSAQAWRLRFMFIGPQQIEHVFETIGGKFVAGGLELPFPVHVERLQRRKNFRMIVPPGSHLLVTTSLFKAFIDLLNISVGGAYGVMNRHNLKGVCGPLLQIGQQLQKTGIFFPRDSVAPEQVVIIEQAVVCRVEKDPEKKIFKYGFEFLEIESGQQKKLTQRLYHLQRLFLKRP